MQANSNYLIVISALVLNFIFLLLMETTDIANAQHSGKMTLTCNHRGNCFTVVCIDDKPCDTIQLNSKNSTGLREFLENKTRADLIPKEIVWYHDGHSEMHGTSIINHFFKLVIKMSVRNTGNRSIGQLLSIKKRLAIIAVSTAGIIFGFALFGI